MNFLKAVQNDMPEIMALYKEVIKTTFTTWDENYPSEDLIKSDIDNGDFYVLKSDGKIVAASFLGQKKDDKELWENALSKPMGVARICVAPNQQGKGIGTTFMRLLIEEAEHRGADGMHFHVCTKNSSAIKMYEKCGFMRYGEVVEQYGFEFFKYEQVF